MNLPIRTKDDAADIFGGSYKALADAIGVGKSAISQWPDVLTQRQIDEVVGCAIRLGFLNEHHLKQVMQEPGLKRAG